MDYTVLEKSPLFAGIPAVELRELLETTPHHIQCYDKGETIFHLMDPATQIGIILEGRLLAVDPGKENREEQSAYSRICFQMGNAYECLNVSRPSLHRELRKLEEAGIITYAPPMITINDREALQDVLCQ